MPHRKAHLPRGLSRGCVAVVLRDSCRSPANRWGTGAGRAPSTSTGPPRRERPHARRRPAPTKQREARGRARVGQLACGSGVGTEPKLQLITLYARRVRTRDAVDWCKGRYVPPLHWWDQTSGAMECNQTKPNPAPFRASFRPLLSSEAYLPALSRGESRKPAREQGSGKKGPRRTLARSHLQLANNSPRQKKGSREPACLAK